MFTTKANIQFIKADDHRMAYRIEGDETGMPVVLIHAFASNASSWISISTHLTKAGFRVITLDLPGHGRSDWAKSYSLASMEDCLSTALNQLDLDQFDLIGHSLGGHLALRLAARLPDKVRRVVVEAAPVPPSNEEDAEAMVHEGAKPSLWQSVKLLGLWRMIRIALLRQFDFRSAKPILKELKKPMPQWWSSLKSIQCPCLLLVGSNDGLNSSRANLITAKMRFSQLRVIGSGHHLHRNHKSAFLEAIMPFLSVSNPSDACATKDAAYV